MIKKTICFIPARSGSKGIKNKNLKKIGNRSLLEITINQAIKSKIFSKIIVSSDSKEILKQAQNLNVLAIKRSDKNSGDNSSTDSALLETVTRLNFKYDDIIILQVTSPLRKISTIRKFKNYCVKNNLNSCCTVTVTDEQIGLKQKFFDPLIQKKKRRRQLRKKFIFENGLIYFINKDYFLKNKKIYPNKNWDYFITERYESLDINSAQDLKIAKLIYNKF